MEKASYHHGNLRQAILDEGLRLIEQEEEISLRQIARNVGVKAPSVYRHFPNKDALLTAFANEGLNQLAEIQGRVSVSGGLNGLAEAGRAYVRFALENPALFKLVFSWIPSDAHPDVPTQPDTAAALLSNLISQVTPPDMEESEQFVRSIRAWSLVHGLAMLIIDRQIEPTQVNPLIDRVIAPDSLIFS